MVDGSSAEETLAIRIRRATIIGRSNFIVPGDFEPLGRRDDLVIKAMWHSTVEDTDTLHGEQL